LALIPATLAFVASVFKFQGRANWHIRKLEGLRALRSRLLYRFQRSRTPTTWQLSPRLWTSSPKICGGNGSESSHLIGAVSSDCTARVHDPSGGISPRRVQAGRDVVGRVSSAITPPEIALHAIIATATLNRIQSPCSLYVLDLSSGDAPTGFPRIASPQRLAGVPAGTDVLSGSDHRPRPPADARSRRSDVRHHPGQATVPAMQGRPCARVSLCGRT
jgi:hypothetical protein